MPYDLCPHVLLLLFLLSLLRLIVFTYFSVRTWNISVLSINTYLLCDVL